MISDADPVHSSSSGSESRLHIGTCGWSYKHWKGAFYPVDLPRWRWLEHYQQHFNAVEVDATFYRLPDDSTFKNWYLHAPVGFRYALKGSRLITHLKRLRGVEDAVAAFCERARLLREFLGPVLWQMPPGSGKDLGLLDEFLSLLPEDMTHVVEFRNAEWYSDDVYELLGRTGRVAMCFHDKKGSEGPLVSTSSTVYFRFHGPQDGEHANYSNVELGRWADRIQAFIESGSDVWAFFNNDADAYAVVNARQLTDAVMNKVN